jgi:Deacetylase PdaC
VKTSPKLISILLLLASISAANAQPAKSRSVDGYTTLTGNKLLDFRYSFPTIVGNYPALLARLRKDQVTSYADGLEMARLDAEARKGQDFPFNRNEFWRDWTVTGNAFPLVSLLSQTEAFTGGAHPNHVSSALLWDEKSDAQVDFDALFGGPAKLWKQIQPDYCRKLGAEQRRRNMGSVGCPERKDLTIVPVDSDFDFHFDTLRIIADPYVAGSYAEGFYVVSLPVTHELIAALEPQYRDSFEAQPQ